jgi:hypothetical protein
MSLLDQILSNTVTTTSEAINAAPTPVAIAQPTKPVVPALFEVESLPLHSQYGTLKGKKGLFVNGSCINIVSDRYEVHQPSEILAEFQEVAASGGIDVEAVKTNPATGAMMIVSSLASCKIAGEDHKAKLIFYTSHDGKNKTFLSLDFLRIVCMNQLRKLYKNESQHIFAEKHYKNALSLKTIGPVIDSLNQELAEQENLAQRLLEKRIDFSKAREVFASHKKYDEQQKQFESKMAEFRATYFSAPGQNDLPDHSAYKLLNAVTYLNTHKVKATQNALETQHITNAKDSLDFVELLLAH